MTRPGVRVIPWIGIVGLIICGFVLGVGFSEWRSPSPHDPFAGYNVKDDSSGRCTVKRYEVHHSDSYIPRGRSMIALSPDKGDYIEMLPAALIYEKWVRGKRKLVDTDPFSTGQVIGESFSYTDAFRLFLGEFGKDYVHVEHHNGKRYVVAEQCWNGVSILPWSGS